MPKLTIDGRSIEVEAGTSVIEAAERLGIVIPRLCYHPALGSVGACRVCAVMFLDGPVKGLDMSCMVKAKDGMVVSTDHPEAQSFRASVVEWLMKDHPHDCPVCDEGGHCQLQDMTVSGGHGLRRYNGPKRTFQDQDLGPLVQHEMNRCIHCYRCVRFYRDYAGFKDLGTFGISRRVYFGRRAPGRLESPFSGNLADVCPTGVFTDKPSRYRARHWDLERAPAVCLHCSLGCNVTAGARYREVLRVEARHNPAVNGHFICDRGRYGFQYANLPDRPRRARLHGHDAETSTAIREAVLRLQSAKKVALLGSARASLETQAALLALAERLDCPPPVFFFTNQERQTCRSAAANLDRGLSAGLEDVRQADFVLLLGADPLNEAPVLALAARRAARNGAAVAALDPRPLELPCEFVHLPVSRARTVHTAASLLRAALEHAGEGEEVRAYLDALPAGPDVPEMDGAWQKSFDRAARGLALAKRPVLVCGTEAVGPGLPDFAAAAVRALRAEGRGAGLFHVLPGPNSFGAAMLDAQEGRSFEDLLPAMESGEIRALVCAEADPLAGFPDQERVSRALDKLELLVVLDYLPTETVRRAHVFLPAQTVFEAGGCYINQAGRLQRSQPVFAGGTPIGPETHGGHPPRDWSAGLPGAEPEPAWRLLKLLGEGLSAKALGGLYDVLTPLRPELAALASGPLPEDGAVVLPGAVAAELSAPPVPEEHASEADGEVLLVRRTFGTEELSSYGPLTAELAGAAEIVMHPADAGAHGLADGDTVLVPLAAGLVSGTLRTRTNMARGCVLLPRRADFGWQSAGAAFVPLALHRVWKEFQQDAAEPWPDEALSDAGETRPEGPDCPWRPK